MRFHGLSANPGHVEGKICIVHNSDEFSHCNAGDVALLVGVKPNVAFASRVSAILSVHGGITSHAAIVARENKKPAVVGLPLEILYHIKNGQAVKVNADAGFVSTL